MNIKDPKLNTDSAATKIIQGVSDRNINQGMVSDYTGAKIKEFKEQGGMQHDPGFRGTSNISETNPSSQYQGQNVDHH